MTNKLELNNQDKFLNEKELATILNIKPETLSNWRWDGKGPIYIKLGSNVRYRLSDVQDFLNGRIRKSTSDMGE
jgi:predicted DNA-binding transcriptional regulator AlpA